MNRFIALVSLIMLTTAISVQAEFSAKLTLEGANGQNHCTLDFKTTEYSFKSNNHCDNDEAIAIELEHVPSASNILLFDDYECEREIGGNYFWIYLRTVKEDLSVAPIDLDEIMTWPKGTPIRPGVLVVDYARQNFESAKQRTSCVKIQVDAPPMP